MRIGINGYEAVVPRFGFDLNGLPNRVGSSEVCFELLLELEKIDKKNNYTVYLPAEPTSDLPGEREGWSYKVISDSKLWTILGLNRKLLIESQDVFFSPTHYSPIWTRCPQVITVLDTSYKFFPELFKKRDLLKLNTWGRYSIKCASKIITISQSSKNDIIKEYKADPDKVVVVYPGLKFESRNMNQKSWEKISEKYKVAKPYVLFVGTLQPRKNLVRLIEAFSKLKTENKDLELVIVGRRGWDYEETFDAPAKFGIESRVRFIENAGDEDLPALYKNAQVFIMPSLYEGFGLPILEAMKNDCPVVTSNISSMPEVGGDAALYFDPENVSDIKVKIEKVLKDEKLRYKMIKMGHEQLKKFSWARAAKEVLGVLESVENKT